jgi:hypothetical protein
LFGAGCDPGIGERGSVLLFVSRTDGGVREPIPERAAGLEESEWQERRIVMAKKNGNSVIVTACSQRASAIKNYLSAKDEIFVGGEQLKAGSVALVYQDALDTRAAAVTAKGEYKSSLAARDAAEAKRLAADVALEPYVLQRFGANSTEAHDFGFAPKKVGEKSAVAKAKATLLNQATRAARGTTSKKEKQKIKGTLSPEIAAALAGLAAPAPAVAGPVGGPIAPPVVPAPAAVPVVAPSPASSPAVAAAAAPAPIVPPTNGAPLNGAAHS